MADGKPLAGKVALVVGAGQTPGDTIGNGRAVALLFAREGARVVAIDRDLASAEETVGMIEREGGLALALAADATIEAEFGVVVERTKQEWGRGQRRGVRGVPGARGRLGAG